MLNPDGPMYFDDKLFTEKANGQSLDKSPFLLYLQATPKLEDKKNFTSENLRICAQISVGLECT